MQKSLRKFSIRSRRFLRPKIAKHKQLQKFTISSYRTFCNLTGFLHVLPDFYILGAEKCGTSSLFIYISEHPSSLHPISKEPKFFGKYYGRGLNWYRVGFPFKFQKYYANNIKQKKLLTGDATVRYLDNPNVPDRIKQVTPNAKFIIMLRNPIDRAYSQYNMMVHDGVENLTFEEALEQEEERAITHFKKMQLDHNYYSDDYFYFGYTHRGIYVDKIKFWMEHFPKENFQIIKSEDFFQDPSEIYKETLDFLQLENYDLKQYKTVGTIAYKDPTMNEKTRENLIEFFKPHNNRLESFLGIKFDWNK